VLVVAGCAKKLPLVSGRVTLDDQPLPNASVLFEPETDGKRVGPGSSAMTNEKGEFTLKQNSTGLPGAMAAKYQVTITALEGPAPPPTEDSPKPRKDKVPAKYKGKLSFEVPAGGTTSANFDLKSR
jgi:hypothetical protein